MLDQTLVVRRHRGVSPARERRLQQPDVRGVDVRLARIRDVGGLEVRALDDAQVRTQRKERGQVVLAPVQVRLQHRPDAFEALLSQPAVAAQRRVDERRLLHVDPDEGPEALRVLYEPLYVRVRELVIELEAEVRELERDVRAQPFRDEPRDRLLVRRDDGLRLRLVAHPLAEERRVRREPALVQPAQYGDALVKGLAGHEPPGAEPHAVLRDEALDPGAVGCGEDGAAHCVVGSRRETHFDRRA